MAGKRLIDANALKRHMIKAMELANQPLINEDDVVYAIDNADAVYAVEIPCRIGDEVWAIRNYQGHKHPQKGFVSDMLFTRDMRLNIVVKHIARGEWGKTVFATYEDAAAYLDGGKA